MMGLPISGAHMKQHQTPVYQLSITKEALASLPPACYHGNIRVIDNEDGLAEALRDLEQSGVVGFDTETRPSFRKGHTNTVALLQLSTGSTCYLIRLNRIGLTPGIKRLLEDDSILKIGLSIHDDFHNLNILSKIEPKGFIDLQQYVKAYRIADNSLARIYAIIFGRRISKGQRLTNWEADSLTSNQQAYAALDALACIEIYRELESGNFDPEASQYKVYPQEEEETSDVNDMQP